MSFRHARSGPLIFLAIRQQAEQVIGELPVSYFGDSKSFKQNASVC